MSNIEYPKTLPCPAVATLTPAERRVLLSEEAALFDSRAVQRDKLAMQAISFPPFTEEQAAEFEDWWREVLLMGGAWFAAEWPLPEGLVLGVRKFLGEPTRQYMEGGFWKVSGQCQVRGRGMPPTNCFRETFGDGIASYSTVTGDASTFSVVDTIYGKGMNVAAVNVVAQPRIRREMTERLVKNVYAKFIITARNAGLTGGLSFRQPSVVNMGMQPNTDAITDGALRRPYFIINSIGYPVADSALDVGVWYEWLVTFASGVGNTISTITRLSDGAVIKVQPISGNYPPMLRSAIEFSTDTAQLSSSIIFTNIRAC